MVGGISPLLQGKVPAFAIRIIVDGHVEVAHICQTDWQTGSGDSILPSSGSRIQDLAILSRSILFPALRPMQFTSPASQVERIFLELVNTEFKASMHCTLGRSIDERKEFVVASILVASTDLLGEPVADIIPLPIP